MNHASKRGVETHARQRARQRLRVELSRDDFCTMVRAIRAGKAERLNDGPLNRKIVRIARRRKSRLELDVDWVEIESDEGFDADALADVLVNTLRSHVKNDVLAVKLKEAGVA